MPRSRSVLLAWARRAAPLLPPVAIFLACLLNGLNSAIGQAASCILAGVPAVILLLLRPPEMWLWRRTWPALALGCLGVLWAMFVSIPWSTTFGAAWPRPFAPDFAPAQALWLVAGLASLVSGLVIGTSRRSTARVLDWLLALLCLTLVIGLVAREFGSTGLLDFWTLERDGRFQGTIGNVNVTATVAGFAAILAFARLPALAKRNAGRRPTLVVTARIFLYGLAALVALGTLIATASRVPAAATLVSLIILAFILFRDTPRYARAMRIAVGAGVVLLGVFLLFYSDLLTERMAAIPAAWQVRGMLWGQYWDAAMRSPLYGYGLGSFTSVNEHFVTDLNASQQTWRVNSPHNLPLQLLLTAGLPYLSAIFAAAAVAIASIVGGRRSWSAEDIGLATGIAMMLCCSLIDIVLDVPATVMIFLFACGLLWSAALGLKVRVAAS